MNAPGGHHEIRHPSEEDFPQFLKTGRAAFGMGVYPGDEDIHRPSFAPDRFHAAYDDGRMVGTIGSFELELTIPGGRVLPAAGLTWAGVLPTHRRTGVLRALMAAQIEQARAASLPLAILNASEGGIYGRFGFGPASSAIDFQVDSSRAAFARPADAPGRIRLVESEEAAGMMAGVYEQTRSLRAGMVSRPPYLWHDLLADPEWQRDGGTPFFFAVHETPAGVADGYLLYRTVPRWTSVGPEYELKVSENVSPDPAVRAALWHFATQVDLVTTVTTETAFPVDESLRWLFADPRTLRLTRLADDLWVRILDLPRALEARAYRAQGRLVLEIEDEDHPGDNGRFELAAGSAGSTVSPSVRDPDVVLGTAALATTYLGGVPFSRLAEAGMVRERHHGALALADLLFGTSAAPFCGTRF